METGIVRHLDDQCIGCSYCILKCPYDVPKYSKKRGIVRKCDMCHQRLAEGEAPACVQACPTEAIRIVKVQREIREVSSTFPDAFPSSNITLPTTRYVGREIPGTAHSADQAALIPQHPHWPLILMLVLTQAGIGFLLSGVNLTGTVIFFAGMAASVFHLGQPLKAWRFFLGLKTSWLSREILAFSMFAPIPLVLCALPWLPDFPFKDLLTMVTAGSALPIGMIAVFTSVMIYHDTHRAFWGFRRGGLRFFGTVAIFFALGAVIADPGSFTPRFLFGITILCKLLPEIAFLRYTGKQNAWSPDAHSARLLTGPLRHVFISRAALDLLALPLAMLNPWLAIPALLMAAIQERRLFFQAVQAPKMPGNFGPAVGSH